MKQPLNPQLIIRLLLVLVILLSFVAGYYHSLYQNEQRKYQKLELEYQTVINENSEQ